MYRRLSRYLAESQAPGGGVTGPAALTVGRRAPLMPLSVAARHTDNLSGCRSRRRPVGQVGPHYRRSSLSDGTPHSSVLTIGECVTQVGLRRLTRTAHGTVWYGTGTARRSTARYSSLRLGTARHGTARHGSVRYGAAAPLRSPRYN